LPVSEVTVGRGNQPNIRETESLSVLFSGLRPEHVKRANQMIRKIFLISNVNLNPRLFPYRVGGDNRIAIYPDNIPSASVAILRPDSSLSVYRVYGGWEEWEINVNSHLGLKLGQEQRKVDCKLEGGQ
jgi:hypothetical protein